MQPGRLKTKEVRKNVGNLLLRGYFIYKCIALLSLRAFAENCILLVVLCLKKVELLLYAIT